MVVLKAAWMSHFQLWLIFCLFYLLLSYLYNAHINIYVLINMPEPGCNLAADACMGWTQLSPCIISVLGHSVPTGMPCQHDIIFYAGSLMSTFPSEICITLLQQLWETVLVWSLYPIFILSNQLAVIITRPYGAPFVSEVRQNWPWRTSVTGRWDGLLKQTARIPHADCFRSP